MGILNFFKRSKKAKTETGNPGSLTPEQTLFADNILAIIGPAVQKFGFVRHRTEVETYFTTIIFRKDKQYIKISGTTFPTDYPYHYNVFLGEGDSEEFYEWDWNSVVLWRLIEKIEPGVIAKEYAFPFGDNVKFSIANANKELLEYGDTFLRGDLGLFYEIRANQNKNREPYKIRSAGKDGNYTISYDPVSVEQKKKYS